MTTLQQDIDTGSTIGTVNAAAMEVRNAILALLRSWEDMHGLPRSVPTVRERHQGSDRGGRAQLLGPHRGRVGDKND